MNELIKFVVTEAIDAVRLTTKSEQAMYTMMTVSVAQFFNTALMLLLQRNSLSCSWYAKSGDTIVETMYLQAYVPVVEFFSSFLVIKLVRLIDRGWSSDVDKTRLPTVDLYLQVHSGPNFDVEGQYSNMLLQISIALFFGIGMPILYPIAVLALIFQYVIDRLMVAYFYCEPPAYDDRMTMVSI
jgi:hypothetical protein